MSRRTLVAVSGGVDSMVLLHRLAEKFSKPSAHLVVAHYNHQLRARSSDADERLVRESARRLGLRCVVGRGDVRAHAKRKGVSIEMAAREVRHEFLAKTARKLGIKTIALAHHADDQVELFFLRLLRGAAAGGLGGMRAASPSPMDEKLGLVRPLLESTKAELRTFAAGQGIRFREDASNARPDFLRNRVRHELLPLLRKFQPALDRVLPRVMRTLAAESDLAHHLASAWLGLRQRPAFSGLPVAMQRHVLEVQLVKLGIAPEFELIESLRGSAGVPVMITPERNVVRDARGVVSMAEPRRLKFTAGGLVVQLPSAVKKTSRHFAAGNFGGIAFDATLISADQARRSLAKRRPSGIEFFDADRLGPRLTLRHWRPGDRFQPIGMKQPVKLQDWFVNRKIPAVRRRELVVAEAADGVLCWVEGERIGELFKLDSFTRRGLKWYWKRRPGWARHLPLSNNGARLPRN
ncbi:MAG: tRNA lysidine(34) synthetase TilS [Verrucomicrobia bacterium]|nr:tRNA lysidine(34) synthetase TilS [Verrucomicrobiota bacterium]